MISSFESQSFISVPLKLKKNIKINVNSTHGSTNANISNIISIKLIRRHFNNLTIYNSKNYEFLNKSYLSSTLYAEILQKIKLFDNNIKISNLSNNETLLSHWKANKLSLLKKIKKHMRSKSFFDFDILNELNELMNNLDFDIDFDFEPVKPRRNRRKTTRKSRTTRYFRIQQIINATDEKCYNGNGKNYRGKADTTIKGTRCLKWTSFSKPKNITAMELEGIGDHNYCRNPDNDSRPWCWVNLKTMQFGYCDISHCQNMSDSTNFTNYLTSNETDASNIECDDLYEMSCSDKCIPLSKICDDHMDCDKGEDEKDCEALNIRLVESSSQGQGLVELTMNNISGIICQDGWNDNSAKVICRMLGYQNLSDSKALNGSYFLLENNNKYNSTVSDKSPVWAGNIECTGQENDIQDCQFAEWGKYRCANVIPAALSCVYLHENQTNALMVHVTENKTCGKRFIRQLNRKIIGGQNAVYGAYPWQVRILARSSSREPFTHKCGGTLIDKRWILTAAHCFQNIRKNHMQVAVGDHFTSRRDQYEETFQIDKIYIHPNYEESEADYSDFDFFLFFFENKINIESNEYDIALIKLKTKSLKNKAMEFNEYVQPACLPTPQTPYINGYRCETTGWGFSDMNAQQISEQLKTVSIPIRTTKDCERFYKVSLSNTALCAGYFDRRYDTCKGDSGGPLVCSFQGTYTIMGITSWGSSCSEEAAPGIYSHIGNLLPWIKSTMNQD